MAEIKTVRVGKRPRRPDTKVVWVVGPPGHGTDAGLTGKKPTLVVNLYPPTFPAYVPHSALFHFSWMAYFLFSPVEKGYGQVANDHVAGRIALRADDAPLWSTTTGCTVEWACVDESLTGKCIEYHNDQWFEFTPRREGKYYVNVSDQDCRDIRGVQLVVMEGTPCRPETYRIRSCTSLATQDDLFIALDSLQKDHSYLLNVDGYLNDFCRFRIGVGGQPKGFPARSIGLQPTPDQTSAERAVRLAWVVTDSLAVSLIGYQLYRRHEKEKKSSLVREVSHEKNTRGESQLHYAAVDTLPERGTYEYQIVGLRNEGVPAWIAQKTVRYRPDPFQPADYLVLRLVYALNTPLTVLVFDAATDRLLQKNDFVQRKGRAWRCYVGEWRDQGILRFRVKVTDHVRKSTREYVVDTQTPE
ncbi:MAG: hypothetical protein H7Z75_00685 [Ferruginibacter sp.]|nr:hypothetical protein [Cytophagales bacterium]